MRTSVLWAAMVATTACGESRPPVMPIDLSKTDPGPNSGRVRKSPFDCADSPRAVSAPPAADALVAPMLRATGVAFDARANRFASWSNGKLVVRNANDGTREWQGAGTAAAFRNDGAKLAAFEGGTIVVRDMPSGTEVLRAPHGAGALGATWSDDGKRVWAIDATAAPGSMVYDVEARTECRGGYPVVPASATSFVVSADRAFAVVTWPGDSTGMPSHAAVVILVQGSPDERVTLANGSAGDASFAFSRTGLVVAAVSAGGPLFTWDSRTGKHGDAMPDSNGAAAVALSDDGVYLAAIQTARVRIWDTRTAKLVRDVTPATGAPFAIAFVPARSRVAIATDGGADVIDVVTGAVAWSRGER